VPLDVEQLRADTPGCADRVHLNNAGASLPTRAVTDAVVEHLRLEAAIGGYEAADARRHALAAVPARAGELIGAAPDEIATFDSATRAWNAVFWALAVSQRWRPGDRVLTARAEYASNYLSFLQAERFLGIEVGVIPSDDAGALDATALPDLLDERVRLVAVTHVPTHGGLVNPAAAVGRTCRAAGVPFLLDACQSVGHLPVDVDEIGCDALSATGRKYLRAPRGTGFLYVRRALAEAIEPAGADLVGARWTGPLAYVLAPGARRFEQFEGSYAARLGMGVALEHLLALGIREVSARIVALGEAQRARLASVPGVVVTDTGHERCGIVTCTVDGRSAVELRDALRAQQINTSVSAAPSALLDMGARRLTEVLRASVHAYNTEAELDRFAAALAAFAPRATSR
jgi:selenocysteine lyase/cysteine desulfurase